MRTAVLTLCALMPAGGHEIFVRRWDKPANPRTDRRKALWNELGDLNGSQVPNADKLVERAANMLRAVTGFKKFCTIQFVNKSEIVEWSLKEHHSREILKCFCDPDMTKNPQTTTASSTPSMGYQRKYWRSTNSLIPAHGPLLQRHSRRVSLVSIDLDVGR